MDPDHVSTNISVNEVQILILDRTIYQFPNLKLPTNPHWPAWQRNGQKPFIMNSKQREIRSISGGSQGVSIIPGLLEATNDKNKHCTSTARNIATYNVLTLSTKQKVIEFEEELKSIK